MTKIKDATVTNNNNNLTDKQTQLEYKSTRKIFCMCPAHLASKDLDASLAFVRKDSSNRFISNNHTGPIQ
jgi:hypothetical protein